MECDDVECATAQCVQDNNGNWHCEGGLDEAKGNTKMTILMHSDDDD
jgi:hypothetical protein